MTTLTAVSKTAGRGADWRAQIGRIAVFRALMLGDVLCAVPALRALRRGFPHAEITLIGLNWARVLAQRLPYIDRFIAFPGYPGLPETPCDVSALPDFLAQVQAQRFDLVLQMHGSGQIANPVVGTFGARHSAGFFSPGAWWPRDDAALYLPWPSAGHEIERLLSLTDALGLPRQGRELEFPVRDEDRRALAGICPELATGRPYVCVHAGAQLPSRRWPVERFAEVADWLAGQGRTVVLTGSESEQGLVDALAAGLRRPPMNLAGRTNLWTLGAVIDGAECVVCNDTGVSHIAAARRTRSVVVSCGADVGRWAPLDRDRHQVLWQPLGCRPCTYEVCPVGHDCAFAIETEQVIEALRELLGGAAQSSHGEERRAPGSLAASGASHG